MSKRHAHPASTQVRLFTVIVPSAILIASWTFIIFSDSVEFGGPGLFLFSLWRKPVGQSGSLSAEAPHSMSANVTSCDHVDVEVSEPCFSVRERINDHMLEIERR